MYSQPRRTRATPKRVFARFYMPYRLGAKLSLPAEVMRIFNEESAGAAVQLAKVDSRKRDKGIHEARKSVKKLRALLRLIAHYRSKRVFEREDGMLRDAGRRLSELRDAQAMVEAFSAVSGNLGVDDETVLMARDLLLLRKQQLASGVDVATVMRETAEALSTACEQIKSRPLPAGGFALIEPGVERSFKRGRKARARAKKDGTPEAFHNWRKRVKEHWYHARLLAETGSSEWIKRTGDLKTLEGLLGDDHNLAVLSEIFRAYEKLSALSSRLSQISGHLRDEALKLGKTLYKGKWSTVADALGDAHAMWPSPPKKQSGKSARPAAKSSAAVA